jgi:lipopolysaccharide export LptBFGC system permease protein LptF
MKENKIIKLLTEEVKGENIIFAVISFVTALLGVLIFIGKLNVKSEMDIIGDHPKVFAGVLVVIGLAGVVYSIIVLLKQINYKKKSVYYEIKDSSDESIKNKFSILNYDNIQIDKLSSSYFITILFNYVEFDFEIEPKEVRMYVDIIEDNDILLTDDEKEKLENLTKTIDSTIVSKDELINIFINYINTNLYEVSNYGKR